MKMIEKLFLTALVAVTLTLCIPQFVSAVAVNRTKKSVARMIDNSGGPIMFNDDKPWKVFEVKDTVTAAQLTDESGVTVTQGLIKRVCVESAPAIPAVADNAILWDTITASDITAGGGGRRLAPPIQRLSGVEKCVELNALFTAGVGIKNGVAGGSTYVYWRELGGYR